MSGQDFYYLFLLLFALSIGGVMTAIHWKDIVRSKKGLVH